MLSFVSAVVGFRAIEWRYRPDPAGALEKYLDSWRGVGAVLNGMRRLGYEAELKKFRVARELPTTRGRACRR